MHYKEEILNFGKNNDLAGILTLPSNSKPIYYPNILFINAGFIHKIGPNRLYIKLARAMSKLGVNCARFDFSGLGDSKININSFNPLTKKSELHELMNVTEKRTGVNTFILFGICSGAEDAYNLALSDDRIKGLFLVDGIYISENLKMRTYELASKQTKNRYYKKYVFNIERWKKILTGKSGLLRKNSINDLFSILVSIFFINRTNNIENNNIENNNEINLSHWKELVNKKIKTNLLFCEGGIAIDVFEMTLKKELLTYTYSKYLKYQVIKDVDHTFTPIWSQDLLIENFRKWTISSFKIQS